MPKTLNVLIVDDSPSVRELLKHIVSSAPDMQVAGLAKDGLEAVQMTQSLHPDVILMDLIMPRMDGLEATSEIMNAVPTPIVLITASLNMHETGIAFRAMSLGALSVQRKPDGPAHPDHANQVAQLVNKLRLMAGVQVIRHRKGLTGVSSGAGAVAGAASGTAAQPVFSPGPAAVGQPSEVRSLTTPPEIIAIAASTGGPAALVTIIQNLPSTFAVPIVIVQHISADFVESLRNWIARETELNVEIARFGERPYPGTVYLAPGGKHLRLTRSQRFEMVDDPGAALHVPSGDALLESVGQSYGKRAIGIVLTGIGEDGARGLRVMSDAGAFTIAQDEATSAVYGMPKAAFTMGAAREVLALHDIAPALVRLCESKENRV